MAQSKVYNGVLPWIVNTFKFVKPELKISNFKLSFVVTTHLASRDLLLLSSSRNELFVYISSLVAWFSDTYARSSGFCFVDSRNTICIFEDIKFSCKCDLLFPAVSKKVHGVKYFYKATYLHERKESRFSSNGV